MTDPRIDGRHITDDELLTLLAETPMASNLIREAVRRGFCLGKTMGGPFDGLMLWVLPHGPMGGPAELVTVRGTSYRLDGPDTLSAPLITGVALYQYKPA